MVVGNLLISSRASLDRTQKLRNPPCYFSNASFSFFSDFIQYSEFYGNKISKVIGTKSTRNTNTTVGEKKGTKAHIGPPSTTQCLK